MKLGLHLMYLPLEIRTWVAPSLGRYNLKGNPSPTIPWRDVQCCKDLLPPGGLLVVKASQGHLREQTHAFVAQWC